MNIKNLSLPMYCLLSVALFLLSERVQAQYDAKDVSFRAKTY